MLGYKLFNSSEKKKIPFSNAIIILATIFFIKAFYLAFFVTPLWDIPDETGHLAYVMHLATGGGLPVLGRATVPSEVMSHVFRVENAPVTSNWIAQHPPLYYYVAAVPFWLAQQFVSDVEILFRIPRIIAVLSGTLLLLVLYRSARLVGLNDRASLCWAGCIGWVPMVSNLSSGISHDVPLFLVCSVVVHCLIYFVLYQKLRAAYAAAVWLAIACGIKMTAWVLLPPFLFVVALELRGEWRCRLLHMFRIGICACSLSVVWMLRNVYEYNDPFYTANTDGTWQISVPLTNSFLEYLGTLPVLEHFFIHFYGLFGWIGSGVGYTRLLQVDGFPRSIFTIVVFCFVFVLCHHFFVVLRDAFLKAGARSLDVSGCRWSLSETSGRIYIVLIYIFVVIFFSLVICFSMGGGLETILRLTILASIFGLGAGAFFAIPLFSQPGDRIFFYGLAAFLFFVVVLLNQVYGLYLLDGRLRATHGRYIYPVLPWLLMSLGMALTGKVWAERLLVVSFVFMVFGELDAYINQVLPFLAKTLT